MLTRILPLLNRLIPAGLAFKGLQKLDPRIGKFLTGSIAAGYTIDQSIGYLRNKFEKGSENKENLRPDERAARREIETSRQVPNFLQSAAAVGGGLLAGGLGLEGEDQASLTMQQATPQNPKTAQQSAQQQPTSAQFGNGTPVPTVIGNMFPEDFEKLISTMIDKGVDPMEMVDYFRSNYPDYIEKLEKESGRPFEMILDDYFKMGPNGKKKKSNLRTTLKNDFEKEYGGKQSADDALLAAMQKILKM